MSEIPRRRISELATRWALEKIPQIVVEGPSDARFLRLVQGEEHCHTDLRSIDVIAIDAIDVPTSVLEAHGIDTTGARQRVLGCIKEAIQQNAEEGFRGVVDADLDMLKGIDLRGPSLCYTDNGCMDAYCWSPQTLGRIIIQMRCEAQIPTPGSVRALFKNLNTCCSIFAAIRYSAFANADWKLLIHRSDKALSIDGCVLSVNVDKYIEQCGIGKSSTIEAKKFIAKCVQDFSVFDPMLTLNSHDLLWLLEFALRALTDGPRLIVTQGQLRAAMIAHGIGRPTLATEPLFVSLRQWAMRIAAVQRAAA